MQFNIHEDFAIGYTQNGDENVISTSFYLKTANNKTYIGKQVYHQSLRLAPNQKEQIIKGKSVKLRIANPPYDDFVVELGLNLSDYALAKSAQMFDIDYKYLIPENQSTAIEYKDLQIADDEKVVYCANTGKPVVVKENSIKNPCK